MFSQTSTQIHGKLQYRKNKFWRASSFAPLSQKNSFVFVHQIWHSKSLNQYSVTQKIRFRLLTDSEQIYRKFQNREKVFGEFQALPRFPRKMVLYSSTKFGILKPWTNIPWPRRFDLGFWQTSKQIYQKLQYREKAFEELQGLSRLPRKIVLYSSTKFGILKP